MTKKEKRNYIKLLIIIIISIMVMLLICNIYKNYKKDITNKSYISKYVSKIEYKELPNTIMELKSNSFIYLSYTGSENVYNFEKKIKKILKQNDLEDSLIYVDCTLLLNQDYSVKNLDKIISVGNKKIILPAIIYFKDNEPIDYIDSTDGIITSDKFQQLLDKFELGK